MRELGAPVDHWTADSEGRFAFQRRYEALPVDHVRFDVSYENEDAFYYYESKKIEYDGSPLQIVMKKYEKVRLQLRVRREDGTPAAGCLYSIVSTGRGGGRPVRERPGNRRRLGG